jgi:hypothetical protein
MSGFKVNFFDVKTKGLGNSQGLFVLLRASRRTDRAYSLITRIFAAAARALAKASGPCAKATAIRR